MLRAILPSQQIETTMRMSQLGLRLPAAGRRPSKFIRAAMTDQRGRATGVMSFVSRHLPVWRSVVALRQQIQAQQKQIQAQQTQIQAQQTQIQAQQRQIQTQQDQLDTLNALATELSAGATLGAARRMIKPAWMRGIRILIFIGARREPYGGSACLHSSLQ